MISTSPEVADALARRSLYLGRRMAADVSVETMACVDELLRELRLFVGSVENDRWYAPPFVRWATSFEGVLAQLSQAIALGGDELPRVAEQLKGEIGSFLFDYRLCAYESAALLGVRRRTPVELLG